MENQESLLQIAAQDEDTLDENALDAVSGGAHSHQRSDSQTSNPTSCDGSVKIGSGQNSTKIRNITDGTSNTLSFGE